MASIHKRPGTKFYHAAFRGPDGRMIFRSTKSTDRQKAMGLAIELERASKMAEAGVLVEAQARKILAGIMERAGGGETLETQSVEEFFREWAGSKAATKKAGTAVRYSAVAERFLAGLGPKAKRPLTALTPRDVQSFIDSRTREGLAPRTLLLDAKIIRTILNTARRRGMLPTNPAEAVDLPTVEGAGVERGTFSPDEVGRLVASAGGEWPTLIRVAYYTGARLSDCCGIQWPNVDLASATLSFVQGKTGRKLTVPLHPDLVRHLKELAPPTPAGPVMPAMASLKPGGRHGLSEGFKRIMAKAGVDSEKVVSAGVRQLSRRSFHALRHSFASGLLNAGVSPELRMKLVGHRSAQVHRGYSHHELANLAAAVAKLPGMTESAGSKSADDRRKATTSHRSSSSK